MARDQLTVVRDKAGYGPAELGHAGSDLCHLVRAVHLGVARVGFQAVERPVLDRVRGEAEGHGCFLAFVWGPMDSGGVDSGGGLRPGLQVDFLDPKNPEGIQKKSTRVGWLTLCFIDDYRE
jgi:hypothetical protein